jgi:hypothetical protein
MLLGVVGSDYDRAEKRIMGFGPTFFLLFSLCFENELLNRLS